MPISIMYGYFVVAKIATLAKISKNHKMSISIRYRKNAKIAKCLSQLGMKKTQKWQNAYLI